MADDSLSDGLRLTPQRPLTDSDRAVLHRVIGMLEDDPGYASALSPGLRDAIGDGTQPQQRELTDQERAGLGSAIQRLIEEWDGPRLFQDPAPAWDLARADIARLGLIWQAVWPRPENPDRPLRVNPADWAPPAVIPDGWVIANAHRPVEGPASARAWQGAPRHGSYKGNHDETIENAVIQIARHYRAAVDPDAPPGSPGAWRESHAR